MQGIRCTDLRTEYLPSPLGIATRFPRLSWRIESEEPDTRQSGFLVEFGPADSDDILWSAEPTTDPGIQAVVYDGPPLDSNSAYRWRVRVSIEGRTQPEEWAHAEFGTGYLAGDPWFGSWVQPRQQPTFPESWTLFDWIRGAGPDTPVGERLRPVQRIRQRFEAGGTVKRARLYATARGVYDIAVNGVAPDDQVLAPGNDSYAHILSVQCYDVTNLVRPGANVVALSLGDGWWAGRIGITGSSAQWGDRTSATWQLSIEYDSGESEWIGSDGTGVSFESPIRYSDIFVGEYLDARRETPGWQLPEFDESAWTPVEVLDDDFDALRGFAGEPIRRIGHLRPVSITEAEGSVIVDFGQVIAGRVRLELVAPERGRAVTLEHTETLAGDGSWFANIAGINKEQKDTYVPRGDAGGEAFEPLFTFHGFRFVRISNLGSVPLASEITAVVIGSDLEPAGSLVTSDERVNRLHENVVWSQRGNFLSIPTDCPQRERVGWAGDIQVFAPAATNNSMVAPFLARWLANLRADQLADGRIPIFSPRTPRDEVLAAEADGIAGIVASAGWSDAITLVPWTLYERYGDEQILRDNYSAMQSWVEYQRSEAESALPGRLDGLDLPDDQRRRNRVLFNTGDHFGDWLAPSTMAGKPIHEAITTAPRLTGETFAVMFQAQSLSILARVARVLGDVPAAIGYEESARVVRTAFAGEYLDDDGLLPVELQGVYVLALAFDMVPLAARERLADRLAELVQANGCRLDTGFLSVPYLLDTLCEIGRPDLARRLFWQSELPSWLYEVDRGATTMWESWDAIAPDGSVRAVSLNHYAFGCVDDWMFRRLAGISPASPGYREITIAPDFDCGLTEVEATRVTPYGTIAVHWMRRDDEVSLTVTIPANCAASVRFAGAAHTVSSGSHEWRVDLGG